MSVTNALRIRPARSSAEIDAFRKLCREYSASLPFSLDYQGFEAELASLPGKFSPPAGEILLAWRGEQAVGCVALRPIPPLPGDPLRVCEMKRMYVAPDARGLGAGRALGEALLQTAAHAGYQLMKLDSDRDFVPATTLYRSLGFTDAPRYNDDPHESTIFMARALP